MPRATKADVFQAKESGSIVIDGTPYGFTAGVTRFRAGHPVVEAMPDCFEPVKPHYDVEDATNEPSTKRGDREGAKI